MCRVRWANIGNVVFYQKANKTKEQFIPEKQSVVILRNTLDTMLTN